MNIDISMVVKTAGARLEINESGILDALKDIYGVIQVTEPVVFQGSLTNINGFLQLEGKAECMYTTLCDMCATPLKETLEVKVEEILVEEQAESESRMEDERFTYRGDRLSLDKILVDMITLALPMQHKCAQDCAVICPKCGEPVTGRGCGCDDNQPIDPRLTALKEYYDQ